jgi:hypothetical protein
MIFISDDALGLLLLGQLVSRLEYGRVAALLRAGMDPEHVARLRALRLSDLRALAASTQPMVSLAIDTEVLARNLSALSERDALSQLRDDFIRQGASPRLMRTLFSVPEKLTFQRRRELKVFRGRGRPQLPGRKLRDAIQARWRVSSALDPRRRYLALREVFPQFSLDALHAIVSEYEAMGVEHTRRPAQSKPRPCRRRTRRMARLSH